MRNVTDVLRVSKRSTVIVTVTGEIGGGDGEAEGAPDLLVRSMDKKSERPDDGERSNDGAGGGDETPVTALYFDSSVALLHAAAALDCATTVYDRLAVESSRGGQRDGVSLLQNVRASGRRC